MWYQGLCLHILLVVVDSFPHPMGKGDLCVDELWMQEVLEHEDQEEHEGDEVPGGGRTLLP